MSFLNFKLFSKLRSIKNIFKIYRNTMKKKNKLISMKEFQKLGELQNKSPDIVPQISKILKKTCPVFKKLSIEDLTNISVSISNIYKGKKNQISYQIKDKSKLRYYDLMQIYDYFRYLGLYDIGLNFRDTAFDILISENPRNLNLLENMKRLIVCIQLEKIQSFAELEKEISLLHSITSYNKKWLRQSGSIYFNKNEIRQRSWNQVSKIYAQYLNGKSIAIVGPLEVNDDLNLEIDNYDIVIRFHFDGRNKLFKKNKKGTKVSITYFNGERGDYFRKTQSYIPSELDWVVYKKNYDNFDHPYYKKNQNLRSLAYAQPLVPSHGNFNLLPICIADLIFHGADNIYVYANDLELSPKREKNYYPITWNYHGKEKELQNESDHDPLTQFDFIKLMFEKKILKGDLRFTEVMGMTRQQYAQKIQNNHQKIKL